MNGLAHGSVPPPDVARPATVGAPERFERRRESVAAVVVLGLVALIHVWQGFLPGRWLLPLDILDGLGAWKSDPDIRAPAANSVLSDVVLQFLPWDVEVRRHLAEGSFPWTDRYSGSGTPLFTNPQTALLSPFTWPRLLLGEAGWVWTVYLRFWIGGLGMLWLATELGAQRRAALLSAVVFQCMGYTVVWSMYPLANVTAALPLLAAAVFRVMRGGTPRRVAGVVLTAALGTAGGHPESLAMGVLATFALLAWTFGRAGRRRYVWALGGAFAGFLLLAVVIVPFLIAALESWMGEKRSDRAPFPARTAAMAAQLLPGFLGGPLGDEIDASALWHPEEGFPVRSSTFLGVGFLLALAAVGRQLPATLRRGLVVGTVGLFLSWCPPGVEILLTHLPIFEHSLPAYRAVGFVIFGSVAAGPALFLLATRRRTLLGLVLLVGGLALAIVGSAPGLAAARPAVTEVARFGLTALRERGALPNPPATYEARLPAYLDAIAVTAFRRLGVPGLAWVLIGTGLLLGPRGRALVLAGAVGELVAFGAGYLPTSPAKLITPPPTVAAVQDLDPVRSFLLIAGPGVFPPNLGTVFELRDLRSYSLLEPAERIDWMWQQGYESSAPLSFPAALEAPQREQLAAVGVRFFLSREPVAGAERIAGGFPPAVALYELLGARPIVAAPNRPPRGAIVGALGSGLGVLLAAVLIGTAAVRCR